MRNKIKLILAGLCIVFFAVWIIKANSGATRAILNHSQDITAGAWYEGDIRTIPLAEWVLDPEIPDNYIPIPGEKEVYMVIDDAGEVLEMRQRTKQDDGSWLWTSIEKDNPYKPVEGKEDIYITDNGEYVKYVRNDDGSFAFVECDENGDTTSPSGSDIPNNYRRVTGNIYAIYDEHGVITGYKERFLDNGNYYWEDCEKPVITTKQTTSGLNDATISYTQPVPITDKTDAAGVRTQTQTYTEKKTENGWTITYQTTITRVYDANGTLISTKKDGPVEINRTQAVNINNNPDPAKIASTLTSEKARVKQGISLDSNMARQVEELINDERLSNGLSVLDFSDAQLNDIATVKVCDMVIYNHAAKESPMYGTAFQLAGRFGVNVSVLNETCWKTMPKTANEINVMFMTQETSKKARMDANASKGAVAIAENNGYFYIYEVFAK